MQVPIIAVPVLVPLMAPRVRATQGTCFSVEDLVICEDSSSEKKPSPTFHEFSSTFSLLSPLEFPYCGTNPQEFVVAICCNSFSAQRLQGNYQPQPDCRKDAETGGVVVWADGCLVSEAQIQANDIPDQPFSLDMVWDI
jgi:hypothetical protein